MVKFVKEISREKKRVGLKSISSRLVAPTWLEPLLSRIKESSPDGHATRPAMVNLPAHGVANTEGVSQHAAAEALLGLTMISKAAALVFRHAQCATKDRTSLTSAR